MNVGNIMDLLKVKILLDILKFFSR